MLRLVIPRSSGPSSSASVAATSSRVRHAARHASSSASRKAPSLDTTTTTAAATPPPATALEQDADVALASSSASSRRPLALTAQARTSSDWPPPPALLANAPVAVSPGKEVQWPANNNQDYRALQRSREEHYRALYNGIESAIDKTDLRHEYLDLEGPWMEWAATRPEEAKRYARARGYLWKPHTMSFEELDQAVEEYGQRAKDRLAYVESSLARHLTRVEEHRTMLQQMHRSVVDTHSATTPVDEANFPHLVQARKDQVALEHPKIFLESSVKFAEAALQSWLLMSHEEQLDVVLRSHWVALSEEEKSANMLRVRYECIRRLGWRKGYSSGYPLPVGVSEERRAQRNETLRLLQEGYKAERRQAQEALRQEEDAMAKEEWAGMSEDARILEERAAWEARDRSLIYLDDTSSSHVLGRRSARWYDLPQRTGEMTFLPNILIRLVPNFTSRKGAYDAFKATFRVPLNMHKHSVRSYLLAIYGLRTTWVRSMVYRSKIHRDNRTRQIIQRGGSRSTYKKVEVGLVEPFVFPDITPAFKRKHLNVIEHQASMRGTYFKMTGRRRWRARMLADPLGKEATYGSVDDKAVQGSDQDGDELIGESGRAEEEDIVKRPKNITAERGAATSPAKDKDRQRTMLWSGGIPTARHSRILAMIHEKRLAREREIRQRAQSLQEQAREESSAEKE